MKSSEIVEVDAPATDAGFNERVNFPRRHFAKAIPAFAPVGMRLLAAAFDLMLVGLLIVSALLLMDVSRWQSSSNSSLWLDVMVLLVCVPFLYFVACWCAFNASPGKLLLSLRIVDASTYQPLSIQQCLLRYIGCVCSVLSLGLGMVGIFNERNPQSWQDKLAGSLVVQH